MFSQCCCSAVEELDISFATSLDERCATSALKLFGVSAAAGDALKPTLLARTPVNKVQAPGLKPLSSAFGSDGVPSFPESAAKGRPCTVFLESPDDTQAAARVSTTYRIEERALVIDLGSGKPSVRCPVDGLEDIYQLSDGPEFFPQSVVLAATNEELESLLYVVYCPEPSNPAVLETLCFLECSSQGRDELMHELTLLSMP
mmetsp:Transcript_19878/g.55363  ORF Transcript_19878/g.55363 Transcript_19878/m.55363 type:complete len:202 (+) Transcript_19878:72-677(+)